MPEIEVGQVAMVPLADIEIGSRVREEMGDLAEMEKSMKERGLISPLAVKELDNNKYILLAGERRFSVLSKNNVELVPVRVFSGDISEHEMKSIELAENFFRKDLEYWEYDNLIREMTEINQQIQGVKAPGPGSHGWGLEDTAKVLGVTKPTVSTAISRARAREAFPELFKGTKTQQDASKIIKKMDEAVVKETIARKLESGKQESSFNQLAKCFMLKDFFDGVKDIPDGVMHLVEIDPPYAINLDGSDVGSSAKVNYDYGKDYNEINRDDYIDFLTNLLSEVYRVMAEHSWLIFWFAPEPWFCPIYKAIIDSGFSSTRMCGIWTKPSGQSKRPEIHLANSYEMFFYAWKGRPALNKAGRGNIFNFPPVPPNQKAHPTERPIELMQEIYDTFAFPGSRILIPFLGSGNGIIAASNLGMSPVGFELGSSYRDSFLIKLHGMK